MAFAYFHKELTPDGFDGKDIFVSGAIGRVLNLGVVHFFVPALDADWVGAH